MARNKDIAHSGAYTFVVIMKNGEVYRDLYTLDALGVRSLNDAKREVAKIATEYCGGEVKSIYATGSKERFA